MLVVIGLGLGGALIYGGSDFLGGIAARRIPSLRVALVTLVAGLATTGVVLPFTSAAWSAPAVAFGAVAGVAAAASLWLLYTAMAAGPISIVSPLVAVVAVVVPVGYGLSRHEPLTRSELVAVGVILIAAVLVGITREGRGERLSLRGLLTGLGAGVAAGAYLIALDSTPPASGLLPVTVQLGVGTVLLGAIIVARVLGRRGVGRIRPGGGPGGPVIGLAPIAGRWPSIWLHASTLAVVSGASQAVGDWLLVTGIHLGALAVMAALMGLYPIGTIALARMVAGERVTGIQFTGLALAVGATALMVVG